MQQLTLLACVLSKHLFSLAEPMPGEHAQGRQCNEQMDTKHPFNVDLHAQVDMQCCVWFDTHRYVQMN